MKQFTILQVGYTHSIYGVSGKYYQLIYTNKNGMGSLQFNGLYGADERMARELKDKGYKEVYTTNDYGKMTRKDMLSIFRSEEEALKIVKSL
jgi:hypothetical protein